MPTTPPGKLLGSGRRADVYEIDEAWVLRRERDGGGDAAAEGAVMAHVHAHGCPVPRVRPSGSRTDLVMERLTGPTMLQACLAGTLDAAEAGSILARLLRDLHAGPPPPLTRPALTEALRRRGANATMTQAEVELLRAAEELILSQAWTG
ncbi:phosphotransferase [Streptomyces sp. NPDC093598]|uniref:phosphotransferase n=1 Tax=Streptomyces sp. NPDC093598 TaxID=3366046 RepID=UPI00380B2A6D